MIRCREGVAGLITEVPDPPVVPAPPVATAPRAMLVTAPALPDSVDTLTQVVRSTASAMALPVSPDWLTTWAPAPLSPAALPYTVASALPLLPDRASAVASRPAPASEKLLPVSPDAAAETAPDAVAQELHTASACPESPDRAVDVAPLFPIAIPATSPVEPLVAVAVLTVLSAPVPVGRTAPPAPSALVIIAPDCPEAAFEVAGPALASEMPYTAPVLPTAAPTARSAGAVTGHAVATPRPATARASALTAIAIAVAVPTEPPQLEGLVIDAVALPPIEIDTATAQAWVASHTRSAPPEDATWTDTVGAGAGAGTEDDAIPFVDAAWAGMRIPSGWFVSSAAAGSSPLPDSPVSASSSSTSW